MLADQLTRALERALIPVFGVSIGREDDRATWRVDYRPEATPAHIATGDAIVQAFDPANDPPYLDDQAAAAVAADVIKAVCALMLDVRLNRRLTPADAPAVRAMFDQLKTYFKFIVQNGL